MAVEDESVLVRLYANGRVAGFAAAPLSLQNRELVEEAVADSANRKTIHAAPPELAAIVPGVGHAIVVPARLASPARETRAATATAGLPAAYLWRMPALPYERALASIVEAYGLSAHEQIVADRLCRDGNPAHGSAHNTLDYDGSRNALAALRRKLGTFSTAATVEQLLTFMDGRPRNAHSAVALSAADLGLSERQFAIARRLANTRVRDTLAAELGISPAVLKAELAEVYLALNVANAGELAAFLVRASQARDRLAAGGDYDRRAHSAGGEARIVERPGGRKVGYSRYGETGRCVVILHSTITCRPAPTRLTGLLIERGYRVLSIDRPGFGPTSPAPEPGIAAHIAAAADDLAAVCAAEGVADVLLVARGAGQMAVALGHAAGDLICAALLIHPPPAVAWSTVDRGPLGAIKRRYARRPAVVRVLITLLLRLANRDRLLAGMRRSFASSPHDLASLADPLLVDDYLHAVEPMVRHGVEGYVTENVAWARNWNPRPLAGKANWRIVFGRDYMLHDPERAARYFAQLLPDTPCITVHGGQMLAYSEPRLVADLIAELDESAPGAREPRPGKSSAEV